jgi:hypothetical protein
MVLTTVNSLSSYKIYGLEFQNKNIDMVSNTSQGGTRSILVRSIEYKYSLKLQALEMADVVSIEEELLTAAITEVAVSIDTDKTGGYLNHMGISGTPSFYLDYESVNITEDEGLYSMTIPLLELDLNPQTRLGV